jgi:hypothetical protein
MRVRPGLSCTFLGWQGCCLQSATTCLYVDPLLVDEVGRGPKHTRANFHFGRGRVFGDLPAADAIFISHEHEDHFSVASLTRIARDVPLYVSDGVSSAARQLLAEMGFAVTYVGPRRPVTIGDLELTFFGPDLVSAYSDDHDEWETLAFAARHPDGAFFTNVDIATRPSMLHWLEEQAQASEILVLVKDGFDLFRPERGLVARMGEHRAFAATGVVHDPQAELAALQQAQSLPPIPGTTVVLRDGRVVAVERADTLVRPRTAGDVSLIAKPFAPPIGEGLDDAPVTGHYLRPDDRELLRAPLRDLAGQIYGRTLYRILMTLRGDYEGSRLPTLALILQAGEEDGTEWCYEYRPSACDFVPIEATFDDVVGRYIGVAIMWAGDFLALSRGEVEPRNLYRATQESWTLEEIAPTVFTKLLWMLYHPLHQPEATLAQYRRALAAEEATAPPLMVARAERPNETAARTD